MKMFRPTLICTTIILLLSCFYSCDRPTHPIDTGKGNRYAKGFRLIEHTHFTEAVVFNPWQAGEVMERYYLVTDSSTSTPSDGIRISVPLSRIAVTSCTHTGFLNALGVLPTLCGICNSELVYTSLPDSGWTDIGDSMHPHAERILLAHPQALMISTYAQDDHKQEQLRKTGIAIICNNEWTEQHPLARAEWIRFIAAFYGLLPQADSLFQETENSYNHLCRLVAEAERSGMRKRTLLTGSNFRGTWYVPSGAGYMGRLFHDAGADYYYSNDSTTGSLPLATEQVLLHFKDADVWVGSDATTLEQLAKADATHTWFKAWQTGQVYNFLRRTHPSGANDFWETGVVRPDLLLADLIWILYPELLPTDYTPFFSNRLP